MYTSIIGIVIILFKCVLYKTFIYTFIIHNIYLMKQTWNRSVLWVDGTSHRCKCALGIAIVTQKLMWNDCITDSVSCSSNMLWYLYRYTVHVLYRILHSTLTDVQHGIDRVYKRDIVLNIKARQKILEGKRHRISWPIC